MADSAIFYPGKERFNFPTIAISSSFYSIQAVIGQISYNSLWFILNKSSFYRGIYFKLWGNRMLENLQDILWWGRWKLFFSNLKFNLKWLSRIIYLQQRASAIALPQTQYKATSPTRKPLWQFKQTYRRIKRNSK